MGHRAAKQIRQDAQWPERLKRLGEFFRGFREKERWFDEMMQECREKMERQNKASFRISTDNGVFHVDDPHFAVLSVWVSDLEEQNGLRSGKINHHLDLEENKKLLEGLEWVCDVPRKPENGDGSVYRMFFAHPGTFYFEPNHGRQDV